MIFADLHSQLATAQLVTGFRRHAGNNRPEACATQLKPLDETSDEPPAADGP